MCTLEGRWEQVYLFMLYVDDILLVTNNLALLYETKIFFQRTLRWRVWAMHKIEIHQDRCQYLISLSQKAYINKVFERFQMQKCLPSARFTMFLMSYVDDKREVFKL